MYDNKTWETLEDPSKEIVLMLLETTRKELELKASVSRDRNNVPMAWFYSKQANALKVAAEHLRGGEF